MNTTLTFEEQGAVLFSSALFCISGVVIFAFTVWRVALGQLRVDDCCCCTLALLIYKRCCACSDLNRKLKEQLKSDDETL